VEKGPILKMTHETPDDPPPLAMAERHDWSLFRTFDGLQQQAGVPARRLRQLVLKEIGDNALDTGAGIDYGDMNDDRYFVEDSGSGLNGTPEQIADLFSMARPMRSSKLLRLPQRGALGNGLRVVAGTVFASEGSLTVITRNKRIELQPLADGTTKVVSVKDADRAIGTRIEIGFGPKMPIGPYALSGISSAVHLAGAGESYRGLSSPYWYDVPQFHELLLAHGAQPVRSLIAQLDGCSGGKAGKIIDSVGLERIACRDVTRGQAEQLLKAARKHSKPVSTDRLGAVGRDAYPGDYYAIDRGIARIGTDAKLQAEIPCVVEVWANKTKFDRDDILVDICINRTPSTGDVRGYRNADKAICVQGSGLHYSCIDAPKRGAFRIHVNVTTPFCPITSHGKAPDLDPFSNLIMGCVSTATRKAQRAAPDERKVSQKDIVFANMEAVVAEVGGNGEDDFGQRQILYRVRKIVKDEIGETLSTPNFNKIMTQYENEHGEIDGMYREPRGSLSHPHSGDVIPLGTRTVENYERPPWEFNNILFIEKEGFSDAARRRGWDKRHDCLIMSSKGFSTRAAKDLVDKIAAHDEPVTVVLAHDADAAGTLIYQTFVEETAARGARKIRVINLGLEPWEAIELDLDPEEFEETETKSGKVLRRPVADYVRKRDKKHPNEAPGGISWEDWLQTNRVELNAFTTPELMAWLDRKLAEHGAVKLIPPGKVIAGEFEDKLAAVVRAAVIERILRDAKSEQQVTKALRKIKRPTAPAFIKGIKAMFAGDDKRPWRDFITYSIKALVKKV
jgi:hypothetical protein